MICGDLSAALTQDGRYDVAIAGDVFVYVGKLDSVVPAAARKSSAGDGLVGCAAVLRMYAQRSEKL